MKKFIYLLLVLSTTFSAISTLAEEKNVDIKVYESQGAKEGDSNRPRNIIRNVSDATIDTDLGLLSLYFNENLANVTITVKNENGNIVASTTCNTSITSSTYLNVPTAAGTYSIDIYGDCVTAYGEYDIN